MKYEMKNSSETDNKSNTSNLSRSKDEWPDYLNPTIAKVINEKLQFPKMTPVQSVVLPIFIREHKDVVVEAVTGSGKTLAFVIPALEMLIKREERGGEKWKKMEIGALIITPTRELAQQIYDVTNVFLGEFNGRFTSALFVGGVGSIVEDVKSLEANGANILVATVGRLEDILNRSALLKKCLKSLEVLILDEADRLLDMGFKDSLENIFKFLPKQRRTGLFSATQTDEIDKLIRAGLRNPCNIQVKQKANPQKTPLGLHNHFIIVKPEQKFFVLFDILKSKKKLKCLVFMNTCACVQYFSKILKNLLNGVKVFELHRKIKDKRTKIFNEFKNLNAGVLVCTDILARGIDMDDVDWVIQYDAPKMVNSFVHRCGRTARSNREGNALTLLLPNEEAFVNFLRINQNVPLQRFDQLAEVDQSAFFAFIKRVQDIASKEREIYEKGKEAFVSHIKAYSNHECSHIFQIKELDLYALGKGFGLLHMPRMPELKKYTDLAPFSSIDVSKIPYKDKNKEKLRQQNPEQLKKAKPKFEKKKESWSNNKEKRLKKEIKQKKKMMIEKKRKHEFTEDDLKEIESDFRELKKLKKK